MKKNKHSILLLPIIVLLYAALYIATSYSVPCEGDCEKVSKVGDVLRNAKSYVYGAFRCTYLQGSDTLCIYVKDTIGVDWSRLADTTCFIAQENGLLQQKIFVVKNAVFPNDTVARKICP